MMWTKLGDAIRGMQVGNGVIIRHIEQFKGGSDSMVFVPGVTLVGEELITAEGMQPAPGHSGMTMHQRVMALEELVKNYSNQILSQKKEYDADLKRQRSNHEDIEASLRVKLKYSEDLATKLQADVVQLQAELARGGLSKLDGNSGILSFLKGNGR